MANTVKPPPNSRNPTRRVGFGQRERVPQGDRIEASLLAEVSESPSPAMRTPSTVTEPGGSPATCDVPTTWPIFGWSGASAVASASQAPRRPDELERRLPGAPRTSVRSEQGGRGREEQTLRGAQATDSRSRRTCCRAGELGADGSSSADAYEACEARGSGSTRRGGHDARRGSPDFGRRCREQLRRALWKLADAGKAPGCRAEAGEERTSVPEQTAAIMRRPAGMWAAPG